ncbi:bifunctional DNA primase/polymerase, partial [Mycobacterium avium]
MTTALAHPRHAATDAGPLLNAALRYAATGLAVFPLRPKTKTPLISRDCGGRGFHDATTDPTHINQWWNDVPTANIGIRPPAGIIVVDVDPRAGGHKELARLVQRHGSLPATWTTRTGSGGLHLWFTTTDLTEVRAQLAPGIDLKTHTTGYLVAPPSLHPNGTRYHWTTTPHHQPAPAPAWL